MAVQAVFQADFTSFDAGVKKAEEGLKSFEGTSQATETSLQRLTDAAGSGVGPAQSLTESYKQFDGALSAAGVHIGPYVKGLEDIAGAAGKSATELGLLGTAGLGLGAALTGWKIGTMIDEMTGLSTVIGDAITAVYGFGDAAEIAGAKQDVINRAIAQGAKETISYTEAIKFNQAAMDQRVAAGINFTGVLADAQREVRNLTEAQKADIEIMQRAGATLEQITAKYGISALAVKELGRSNQVTADQVEKTAAAHDKAAAAAAKLDSEYAKLMSDTSNRTQLAIMEADATYLAEQAQWRQNEAWMAVYRARSEYEAQTAALIEQEAMLEAAYQETVAAAAAATQGMVVGHQQIAAQVEQATASIVGQASSLVGGGYLPPGASQILSGGTRATAESIQRASEQGRYYGPTTGTGSPDFSKLNPLGGRPTSALNVINTFNLTDTESNLARRVSDEILRTVRAGTQLGTA